MGFDMQNAWRVSDINLKYKYDTHTHGPPQSQRRAGGFMIKLLPHHVRHSTTPLISETTLS